MSSIDEQIKAGYDKERQMEATRPKLMACTGETNAILEAIAALAAGLTARDRQLSAISEQIQKFEQAMRTHHLEFHNRLAGVETAIKGLGEMVQQGREANYAILKANQILIQDAKERVERLPAAFIYQITRQEMAKNLKFRDLAAAPKQKQRRKGKK